MVKLISMILERVPCVVTNILNSILKIGKLCLFDGPNSVFELSETSRDPKIACAMIKKKKRLRWTHFTPLCNKPTETRPTRFFLLTQ